MLSTFGATPHAILFTGGADVIRNEAWPFYRTISGVRLCWELEEPKGPKVTKQLQERTDGSKNAHGIAFEGPRIAHYRARFVKMSGYRGTSLKTKCLTVGTVGRCPQGGGLVLRHFEVSTLQGCLAHKKQPPP